jgi:Tol biopolymer transport system component
MSHQSRGHRAVLTGVLASLALAVPASAAPLTELASVSTAGTSGGDALGVDVSADGRWVVVADSASDLAPPSTGNTESIFLRDRKEHTTRQLTLGAGGAALNGDADAPTISADGRLTAFFSTATNLAGTSSPGGYQAYVVDRDTGAIRRLSTNVAPGNVYDLVNDVKISADGRYVVYTANDSQTSRSDVFVADLGTGAIRRVAEPTTGTAANGSVFAPVLSADGRWVAYASSATDLVSGDANAKTDVFAENLATGAKERVSTGNGGTEANDNSGSPALSGDGCLVAFSSQARNLVAGADTAATRTFVRDRCAGGVEVGSVANDGSFATSSGGPSLSGDGCQVAFNTATAFGAAQSGRAVAVHDRCAGGTVRADVNTAGDVANVASTPLRPRLSAGTGRYVVFVSQATNLSPLDTDSDLDAFLRDRGTNTPPRADATVTPDVNRATVDATASSDPDGYVLTGTIDFGDGSPPATGLTATHVYARGGAYLVTIAVTDADGATDRSFKSVTVSDAPAPPQGSTPPGDGGSPGGGTGGGTGGPLAAVPRLSGAKLSVTRFAVAPKGGKPPATLRVTLSEPATLKLSFARKARGRRSHGRCVAGGKKGARCTAYKAAGALSRAFGAGAASVPLTGRIGSRALRPATYRLTLVARTDDGRASAPMTLSLTITSARSAR